MELVADRTDPDETIIRHADVASWAEPGLACGGIGRTQPGALPAQQVIGRDVVRLYRHRVPPVENVAAVLAHVTAALPAHEDRPGQQRMAQAVADSIESGRHLVVQAGTGTGKTLAYLVGAAVMGKKLVVATATN